MNTITFLHDSWTLALESQGLKENETWPQVVVQKLSLVESDGQIQFKPKEKKGLLQLFTPKKDARSFTHLVEKVRSLFYALPSKLSEEERSYCLVVEERINTLGRYVFATRYERALFCFQAPKLADYQIRILNPHNQLVEPDLMKRGLSNPIQSHCWLNASLKFLAATPLYDSMLTTPSMDPAYEVIRKSLFRVVEALRMNWAQEVVHALHQELVHELRSSEFRIFFDEQQDADEFIVQLNNHFSSPKREPISYVKLYKSSLEHIWKPGALLTTDKLQITPGAGKTFTLEECFMQEGLVEQVRDYCKDDVPSPSQVPLDFGTLEMVTSYPEYVEVMIKRSIGFDSTQNNGHVSTAKIALDDDGCVELTEYDPLFKVLDDKSYVIDATAKKPTRKFQAIAAIERCGRISSQGHYITHARAKSGSITTYDDTRVLTNRTEAVWANAYYLILKQVPSTR